MDYYIYKNEQNVGPMPEHEVVSRIRDRRFVLDDLACRVGETEWKDLSFFFPLEAPPVLSTQPLYQPQIPAPVPVLPAYQPPVRAQPQAGNPFQQGQGSYASPPYGRNQMQPVVNYSLSGDPYQTGNYQLGSRFFALWIDVIIGIPFAIMAAIPFVGIVGAPLLCAYLISRDAIFGGQSVGKRILGLRVIKTDGSPFTWADSVRRNIIYFAVLLLMVPWVGHVLHSVVAGPVGIVELILVLTGGRRIGDRMGDTYVVKV